MARETGTTTVEFEVNGDFCDPTCPWLDEPEEGEATCLLQPADLKAYTIERDPIKDYQNPPEMIQPKISYIRCKECRGIMPQRGLYRRCPKRGGVRVYPTPEQIYQGEWVPAEKFLDFRKTMAGWFIKCEFCWHKFEEDNLEVVDVSFAVRKGQNGQARHVGTVHELFHLAEVPQEARETFMIWIQDMYEDVIDITDGVVYQMWDEDQDD